MANLSKLADGLYTRMHIHEEGAIAPELKEFLPYFDDRYFGVTVQAGRVTKIHMQKPGSGIKKEEIAVEYVDMDDDEQLADLAGLAAREAQPEAPRNPVDALSFAELRALCVGKGLSGSGKREELIARLKAAESDK